MWWLTASVVVATLLGAIWFVFRFRAREGHEIDDPLLVLGVGLVAVGAATFLTLGSIMLLVMFIGGVMVLLSRWKATPR